MKPRCVVAMTLLGWYVLIPPTNGNLTLNLNAPLARWIKYKSFESLHDCVLGAAELTQRGAGDRNIRPGLEFTNLRLRQFGEALCVSDTDPRLAEK